MSTKSGVWIDAKRALIVKLTGEDKTLKIINSGVESREREPGEGKRFGRFSNQYLSFEKRKQGKLSEQEKRYFKEVLSELEDCEELVLFGPAGIKTKLEKEIQSNKALKVDLKGVEDADSMTDNQVTAWVLEYYEKHS